MFNTRTKFKDFVEYYENNTANFKHFRLQREDISEIFDVIGDLKDYGYEFTKDLSFIGSGESYSDKIRYSSKFPVENGYTGHFIEFKMQIPKSIEVKNDISEIYTRLIGMGYKCYFFNSHSVYFHLQVATPESYPDLKSSKRKPFSRLF